MASGSSLNTFLPADGEPPASNYASLTTRNGILLLDFDPATEWSVVFRGVLPSVYGGGGLTIDLYWVAATATTGDVKWGVSIERDNAANHDLDADAFATEQVGTTTTDATAGKVAKTTITVSSGANMDSLAAGEPYRLKVARKAADAADTMSGNAELLAAHVRET